MSQNDTKFAEPFTSEDVKTELCARCNGLLSSYCFDLPTLNEDGLGKCHGCERMVCLDCSVSFDGVFKCMHCYDSCTYEYVIKQETPSVEH